MLLIFSQLKHKTNLKKIYKHILQLRRNDEHNSVLVINVFIK